MNGGTERRDAIVARATCTIRWPMRDTAFEKRFGKDLDGPSIPTESLVEYCPVTAKDKSKIHQFGWASFNVRGGGLAGDLLIAD